MPFGVISIRVSLTETEREREREREAYMSQCAEFQIVVVITVIIKIIIKQSASIQSLSLNQSSDIDRERERERERERDARKDRCLSTKLSQRLCRHHAVHLLDRCRRSLPLADPHLAEPSCADLAKESNVFRIDGPVRSSCFFEELWYLDCILGVHWKQYGELCGFTKTIDDESTIQDEGTLVSWSIDASEIEREREREREKYLLVRGVCSL